jgi:hypothetical protein
MKNKKEVFRIKVGTLLSPVRVQVESRHKIRKAAKERRKKVKAMKFETED